MPEIAIGPAPILAFLIGALNSFLYVLIRGYASVAELQQSQDAFYGSAEWRDGPREAIVSLIESDISVVIPADSLSGGRSPTEPA